MPARDPNIALPALVGRPALAPVDAFFQEHRRCGDLDGGVEDGRVWIACDCGADIVHPVQGAEPAYPDR